MQINTINASILQHPCDVLVLGIFKGVTELSGAAAAVDNALGGLISSVITTEGFEGKLGETRAIHTQGKIPAARVILTGLGDPEKPDLENARRAFAAACRHARDTKARTVAAVDECSHIPMRLAQAMVEGAIIGAYRYLDYKTDPDRHEIESLTIVTPTAEGAAAAEAGARRGEIVAQAVNATRDLVNAPANTVTPTFLADCAEEIAATCGLELTVLNREECAAMGMGAFLAVSQGSAQRPRFIVLRYRGGGSGAKTVAIVGKGITFDSGGLSLKPADGMASMKDDMAGAAAVLQTMRAVAQLKPKVNVVGIAAATENLPSGTAVKPGDVVRAINGKTIEIVNTDAEGRLTLADAVGYAAAQGADEIVDLATLTGACVTALGNRISGAFCNDDDLAARLIACGRTSGDLLWQMPLFQEYRELLDSDVADIKNTGGRAAAAINGGMFISEFTGGTSWAHLDIAGPATSSKEDILTGKGATGVGVRLLVEYLCGEPGQE